MKRIVVPFLIGMFLITNAYAAQVSKPKTFSAGQVISSADVNSDFDTIYNEFNGSISGGASGNLAADTLTEREMADDINPRVRWDEGFQDFTYTGLQPATSASLTSNISAGTAYVDGYRVNKASATSHTYTASKDTYVDIGYEGTFHYTEVTLLAAAPAVYANSTRLAAVGTTGTAIASVTDLRTLTPYTNASAHIITRGFELVYSSTTALIVNPGSLNHNTTAINKNATTPLTLATVGDWWDGAADSYAGGAGWCYIGVNSSGSIKLLGANPPNRSDTGGSTVGTLIYWYDTSAYWRVIGAVRVDTNNQLPAANK